MRLVWLYVLGFVMVWPVHWTAATVGDKPIDLMASDLLFALMPISYVLLTIGRSNRPSKSLDKPQAHADAKPVALALIFVVYAMALAGIGLGMSGEMIRLYSAFKLAKPIGFVILGVLLGSWTDPYEFIKVTTHAFGVIVALTMFTTATGPEFPLGEWGRFLFLDYELSGYPNSPMSFYAALVPWLLAAVDGSRYRFAPLYGWGLAACSSLIVLGSMSRSSSIALIVGIILYLILTGRITLLVSSFLIVLVLSAIGVGVVSALRDTEMLSILMDRIQSRIDRSTETDDPTSGRLEIWRLAIELWTERPAFGYLFESFSRYASVDTPHQQYLEVLHKCGGIGLILYMGLLISCLTCIRRLQKMSVRGSRIWYQLHAVTAMIGGIMVGNLTQPNLTFSLTGNFLFLICGCLCSAQAAAIAERATAQYRARLLIGTTRPATRSAA